jgi:hypothetical protein
MEQWGDRIYLCGILTRQDGGVWILINTSDAHETSCEEMAAPKHIETWWSSFYHWIGLSKVAGHTFCYVASMSPASRWAYIEDICQRISFVYYLMVCLQEFYPNLKRATPTQGILANVYNTFSLKSYLTWFSALAYSSSGNVDLILLLWCICTHTHTHTQTFDLEAEIVQQVLLNMVTQNATLLNWWLKW